MKLTRAQFLKALPAAALVLAGCTAAPTAPADTDELVFDHAYPLDYATQFTADCYADGSTLLTIPDAQAKFLIRPEGAATLRTVPAGVTVLQQPVQNIYLVSTSAMDLFLHLDALDSIALSGTRAEGWYLDEAKQAMQAGRIAYAGKYSAPDYERILTAECGLAVENTMIYHTPEVKEQLERFGIPVLVERSSYESSPLARMEWIKLYGILLGKEALAEEVFAQQAQRIAPLLEQPSTGKRCAFFSITSSGLATVRKSGDYVAQMIGMAGGEYVFADLADSGNSLSTINIPLEDLYAGVKDADVLIYNGTIEGTISTKEELLARCALLAECKAVQSGNIWCTTPSFFQQSMALADFMLDLHAVFTGETADPDTTLNGACCAVPCFVYPQASLQEYRCVYSRLKNSASGCHSYRDGLFCYPSAPACYKSQAVFLYPFSFSPALPLFCLLFSYRSFFLLCCCCYCFRVRVRVSAVLCQACGSLPKGAFLSTYRFYLFLLYQPFSHLLLLNSSDVCSHAAKRFLYCLISSVDMRYTAYCRCSFRTQSRNDQCRPSSEIGRNQLRCRKTSYSLHHRNSALRLDFSPHTKKLAHMTIAVIKYIFHKHRSSVRHSAYSHKRRLCVCRKIRIRHRPYSMRSLQPFRRFDINAVLAE